jgi:taurine dioxygenase
MDIRRLSPALGAEVRGVDFSGTVSDAAVATLRAAWLEHGVLVIRGQRMTAAQQVGFTRRLGDPVVYTRSENAHPEHPELLVLSNVIVNGRRLGAAISGRYWHTDGHFLAAPPAGTLLCAQLVPAVGGDTWFANMTAAYEALPPAMVARLGGLRILVSRVGSLPYHYPERPALPANQRELWPDMPQPLVRTHPETGRKALYFGGIVPWQIVGMPAVESKELLEELQAFALSPPFIHAHRWEAGDAVLWDNRCIAHRATEYDMTKYSRTMYRTTIAGDPPV